ncbi:IPT/TIG domain-containing protein [Sandaracinus amylolyticus]|uniref:IPT/TIG domain-containing protein n=1 Tax=Sandaracinus amylolyticus TaxID=927083 RepID=UPI001F3523DA|nr:IPT/TIG domain-containing protein [Sandaracinus amylolyticus]UJR81802.1 IPT/TIG domain-containing protein [Sandaracinus amylolyticus]
MSGRFLLLALVATSLAAGCNRPGAIDLPDAAGIDAATPIDSGVPTFSDSAIANTSLSLDRVVPAHGPFVGGNQAILRGTGFTDDAQVTIGGRAVQPADHQLIDSRRLAVIVPAGDVGPADVEVQVGDDVVVLEDGYTYDALQVDPARGSIAGGTFVTITGSGTTFAAGDTVIFGRMPCTDVTVVSETRITCRTPASSAGEVDVTVRRAADGAETIAEDAFEYYDTSDPLNGGLGGGTISGSLNVTVVDWFTDTPLEGAFVIVGEDLATPHQGLSNALGQITFSGPDIVGPLTVHVAKDCYQRTSVVAFDASDVTVFLRMWDPLTLPERCRSDGEPPPPTGGRGRNLSFVEGDLIWRGPNEYGPNPWANIPEPRDGWERVAYVYTTVREIGLANPDPAAGGAHQRVIEVLPDDGTQHLGYPYRILAYPRGMAVYALAGLQERRTGGRFIPYVMGVARSVLAGPGDTVSGVDIVMDIPLDHYVDVDLGTLPASTPVGPNRFRVQAFLDLGGEGLIRRQVASQDFDTLRRYDAARDFRFVSQPALSGSIADGRYRVTAGWFSGDGDGEPFTYAVRNGVTAVDETVLMPDFLGVPIAVAPSVGQSLPADRILRWRADGGPTPDLYWLLLFSEDGNLAWEMFVPGTVTSAPMPDLSTIPELFDVPDGAIYWQVRSARIPGFDFDELSYAQLSDRYWSHSARNTFIVQR